MLALAACCNTQNNLQAQESHKKFTLTNGRVWWMDATVCDQTKKYPMAYDHQDGWAKVHVYGNQHVTEFVEQGEHYLALLVKDTTIDENPTQIGRIIDRPVSEGFTPYCVWTRTGTTGYYYQEWGNFRYYLVGSPDALRVVQLPIGKALDDATFWYDWDYGCGITDVNYVNGVRKETTHWIYYDTVGQQAGLTVKGWKMVPTDSYERPENVVYEGWTGNPSNDDLTKWYYYSYNKGTWTNEELNNGHSVSVPDDEGYYHDGLYHAYGNAATYLPVQEINHPTTIENYSTSVGVTVDDDTLRYTESATISLNLASQTISATVRPAYTEYREEKSRCGINLDYQERGTAELFDSAGVPVRQTYYYQDGVQILNIPDVETPTLTLATVTFHLDPRLRRYLQVYGDAVGDEGTIHDTTLVVDGGTNLSQIMKVRSYSIPSSNITAPLSLYLKFSYTVGGDPTLYYAYDTLQVTLTASNHVNKVEITEPKYAPIVYGYVCGGGRMANVGIDNGETGESPTNNISGGNTKITIHNADTIYAVYGGNDIAGWVQGSATIQVGTLNTVTPLRLGYLYGGGCGYYSYSSVYNAANNTWAADNVITDIVGYGNYCFGNGTNTGKVYPWKWKLNEHTPEENEAHVIAKDFGYTPYTASTDFSHGEKGQGGNGTVPYIKTAHIKIGVPTGYGEGAAPDDATARAHNDLIRLDTVFGGAENAFIGIDGVLGMDSRAVTVDVYGGSIMALFGGNNYGGSVAEKSHTYITVESTKLAPDVYADDPETIEAIVNTYYTGYGRDFGIRHLYGGGNMVESAHAQVAVHGGMIDTCFLGGNRASVVQPIGTIDCRGKGFIYKNPAFPFLFAKKHEGGSLENNPSYIDMNKATVTGNTEGWESVRTAFLQHNPGEYDSENGRYNIRVLFGGNNKAPMNNLSYVHIRAGGVSYVYGGGNEGDMTNNRPWTDAYYQQPTPENATVLNLEDSVNAKFTGWIYDRPAVFGSMVNASRAARMIVENIYGGCRKANVDYSSGVALSGGIYGYVQGGCDISGDVGSNHSKNGEFEGTWSILEENVIVLQDVYGGSDGYYHCHMDGIYTETDVLDYNLEPYDFYHDHVGLPIPTLNNSNLYIHGGHVLFSAYGGGVMCDIGFKQKDGDYYRYNYTTGTRERLDVDKQKGTIHFQINGGTIGSPWWHQNANLLDGESIVSASALSAKRRAAKDADLLANNDGNTYGGGYLSSLYGLSYFLIASDTSDANNANWRHPKIYGSVFAGNDCMGSIASFGKYQMPGSTPEAFLASDGTPVNGSGKALFDAYVRLEGYPRIACVYGSGNGAYDYDGTRPEYSSMEPVCQDGKVDNRPFQSSTLIDIYTSGGFIDTIFGGGNGVGVREDAEVLLNTKRKYNINHTLARADSLFVGTIFGGNNRDDMKDCVPDIVLKRGTVRDVYGGGNAGSMYGFQTITDACGNSIERVSAYVRVEHEDVHVTQNIFGGCRMADVEGMAYVDVRGTDAMGINHLYGGNDISGQIRGNTRVDVSGGLVKHIYGGSNGYYDYEHLTSLVNGADSIAVWVLGHKPANPGTGDASYLVARNSSGEPYVDDAKVNLWGGTIDNHVYGGGRLGDCRNTTVVVDDHACYMADVDDPSTPAIDESSTYRKLYINGEVYGGGEGLWRQLDQPHRGNSGENTTGYATGNEAVGASTVHLHHAESLSNARAYGGGRGGDAYNTYVYLYDTWDKPFEAIYGGCWGSNVKGTAHVVLEGITQMDNLVNQEIVTAKNVFGGNDFTGNVYASDITVNSGTYGNIYGAGDGHGGSEGVEDAYGITDYGAYAKYYVGGSGPYEYGTGLRVPNTEYITINFNDGRVTGNVYGGGKLGTTFSYRKDAEGHYVDGLGNVVNSALESVADTLETAGTTYAPDKYSYIITNIHGGKIDQNVFGGGSGVLGGDPIVYGLKEVNMDGGQIGHSLYGGSANVSDGYYHECVAANNTSARPSSIVNFTGGAVGAHVFGCGYMGVTRGSAYVNVGIDAIELTPLWNETVAGHDAAYAAFKPGATGSHAPALTEAALTIGQSVYGGPNWGNSSGNANFTDPGIFGGRTHVFIDGNNYNTGMTGDESKPEMNIVDGSVIGAGTSAAGGDVSNRIDLRNYGAMNNDCVPTRSLKAIQRTNELWLNNTAIEYTGSTDAISAYLSNQITLNRINTLHNVGYNVIYVDHAIINIGKVNFWKPVAYPYSTLVPAERGDLDNCYTQGGGCLACSTTGGDRYLCDELSVLDRTDPARSYTALVINSGVNVEFSYNSQYSEVNGYAYLMAPEGTNAIVTARHKYGNEHQDDGGFMTACADSLQSLTGYSGQEWNLTWCNCVRTSASASQALDGSSTTSDCFRNGEYIAEYPYYNYSTTYRVWSLGNGTRRRFAVLQAHSTTAFSDGENKMITLQFDRGYDHDNSNDSVYNLGIAHSTLKLPPTNPGNYYKINPTFGVELNDENEEMRLTDQAYKPTVDWDKTPAEGGLTDHWALPTATPGMPYSGLTSEQIAEIEPDGHGTMEILGVSAGTQLGINAIYNNPNTNFALMMVSGENFAKTDGGELIRPDRYIGDTTWTGSTPISGNNFVNTLANFTSAKVGADANASPEMDLYLLYDNRFSHTMLGTVKMVLDEYEYIALRNKDGQFITLIDADGNPSTHQAADSVVIGEQQYNNETHKLDTVYYNGYGRANLVWQEHNLNMPIEVEISIATILEDFADMEYEVLAMYNEGRYNQFTRKMVLPATLQNRELRLMGLTWAPTDDNGNWLTSATPAPGPTQFYMTDDLQGEILNAAAGQNNRFGMKISVTDNISNNLTSSVGWYAKTMETPTDLYTMSGAPASDTLRVSGGHNNSNNYVGPDIPRQNINGVDGIVLGVLDGRGEAAINLDFFFDGNRIYPATLHKGYVGKVILHMRSMNTTGDPHYNTFDITVYVKTRAHGDTIYVASTPLTITRGGRTVHAHTGDITPTCGKHPDNYLTNFYDAFTGPYKEGDVIAILDEVIIPAHTAVFIKGLEHVPVPVIRYSGHHTEFPGEKCAYRGPMITVDGDDAIFTARCIEFNGSMLTKTKPQITLRSDGSWIENTQGHMYDTEHPENYWFDGLPLADWNTAHPEVLDDYTLHDDGHGTITAELVKDKYADTLMAFGPIIRVKNGGTVALQNGVTVNRNYNIHDSVNNPAVDDPSLYGALSVTAGGTLQLINNVTIKENLSKTLGDTPEHPLNGAVYVNGGILELPASVNENTKIEVQQNLLVKNASTHFWTTDNIVIKGLMDHGVPVNTQEPVHYSFTSDAIFTDENRIEDAHKSNFHLANVLLTRTGSNPLTDTQTDIIHSSKAPTALTKIGVSKWFPGGTEEAIAADRMTRDTIQIVNQTTSTMLENAVYTNKNFTSDDDQFVFYNYGVNTQTVYLQRCATFGFQDGDGTTNYIATSGATPLETNLLLGNVLDYVPRLDARCPTGGDSLVCRTKGGFFPYTYTWTDDDNGTGNELRNYTTPYSTIQTNTQSESQRSAAAAERDFSALRAALYDSLFVPAVAMLHTETNKDVKYSVTVNDVTGNCPIKKNIHIKLVKDISGNAVTPFIKYQTDAAETAYWAETANPGNTALGTRTYEAIKIEPVVWSDRSMGTIAARITGDTRTTDSIYTVDGDEHNPIANMSFCEGDVILLSTSPRYTGPANNPVYTSKFVMWDFSPYYSNPVAFVVPPYSTQVVAYYKPLDYWKDVVTNVDIAKAYYSDSYIYVNKPAGDAGYVTTYHGDVHIYNENGLAWFISVVNGLNGTQARTFYFNRVYLHQKDGGYDMKDHMWTPVGTLQHRFRGGFYGVNNTSDSCTQLSYEPVVIKNIIVDEPDLEHTGFFAFLDSAVVDNIQLEGELIRGAQYVGGLAAKSEHSKIINTKVLNSDEPAAPYSTAEQRNPSLTILTTHHTSGGLIGKSSFDSIDNCEVAAKYVGDAVYNGGVVGYGTSIKVYNSGTLNLNRMNAVYTGGVAGYLDGTNITPSTRNRAKSATDKRSKVMNNYVQFRNEAHNQRVGGLAGYAKNTVFENNYIYGQLNGESTDGGVGAILDSGAMANHNYYEGTATKRSVGQLRANATSSNSSDFSGQGNQVKLSTRDYGVDNLTRVLNIWVRANGSNFKSWRSDLEGANNGYPLFGTPDMIPVSDSLTVTGCDSVEWDGVTYLFDDEIVSHIVDSVMMVDSTFTLHVMVNHATREQVEDSVNVGYGYTGHGFELTETEVLMLYRTVGRSHSTTIVLTDTLQTAAGCDSIVTLMLTINPRLEIEETPVLNQIKVYPNPTTSRVTVEATEAMSHVELYDNHGRRLESYNTHNSNDITIDVSRYPSGAYYLRVHTADNVTIQKLIKK